MHMVWYPVIPIVYTVQFIYEWYARISQLCYRFFLLILKFTIYLYRRAPLFQGLQILQMDYKEVHPTVAM